MFCKTVFLLLDLGMIKGFSTPTRILECKGFKLFEHCDFGTDWPAFDQAGCDRDVIAGQCLAIIKGADSMTNVEIEVPKSGGERSQSLCT